MSGVNKAIILGRLGRDPEARVTQSGTNVCSLNIATDNKYKNKAGEMVEETEWHKVTVWGNVAEACSKYLEKGRQVYVEGRLKTEKYTDKNGVDKYSTTIVAERVQFIGGRSDGGGKPSQGNDPSDDEIPF